MITGAISHLAVVEGATVLRTQCLQETANLLLSMAKRLQDGCRDLGPKHRPDPMPNPGTAAGLIRTPVVVVRTWLAAQDGTCQR